MRRLLPWALPVALLAYAVALAIWGAHLAPWWTTALQAPRVAVGAAVTWAALRRPRGVAWTPSQRVGLLLAAGGLAAVLAGLWPRWGDVRLLSAVVYVAIGVVVVVAKAARTP